MKTAAYFIVILFIVVACAQMDPLAGGPDDEYAPAIDSSHCYPFPGQVNFSGSELKIKFNEYIKLVKPTENIIISPSVNRVEYASKNKTVSIKFQSPLEPNTTYSINFNRAVADLNELNDSIFQFVFSTGAYLDSMRLSGTVSDGFTNKPEKDLLIALYPSSVEENVDSIPYNVKPMYIGQTNENGQFQLNYLKTGDYYLFAIGDINKNLKLDPGEKLAFPVDPIVAIETQSNPATLKSFKPTSGTCKITETRYTWPGRLEFIFNVEPHSFSVWSDISLSQEDTKKGDSLVFWLNENPHSGMQFYTELNGVLDTIKPFFKGLPEAGSPPPQLTLQSNVKDGKLLPGEDLIVTFNAPIDSILPGGIWFIDKDSNTVDLAGALENVRSVRFPTAGHNIAKVIVDSLKVVSVFGKHYEKRSEILFQNRSEDYFGTVTIILDSLVEEDILVELIDLKGNVVVDSVEYSRSMKFTKLEPVNYQFRLIFDENGDGRWTSGDLTMGKVPERVLYFSGEIQVKSRWEKEIEWQVNY